VFLCPRWKRKKGGFISYGCTCLAGISFIIIKNSYIASIIFIAIARFSIAFAYSFYLLWINELYPTTVRSVGNGLVDGLGLLGAESVPFLINLSEYIDVHPMFLIGILGLIALFPILFLKETKGKKMLDEIEEIVKEQQIKILENKLDHS